MHRPYLAEREEPPSACAAILKHLLHERDVWKRHLLLADFAAKLEAVPLEIADTWRQVAISSCIPGRPPEVPMSAEELGRWIPPRTVDVAITTVTPTERRAAIDAFEIDEDDFEEHSGRRYYSFAIASKRNPETLSAVLTSINLPLNVRATKAVFELRRHFKAQAYFLLGIAAGRRGKVEPGDVVTPQGVLYYPPGRSKPSGVEPRFEHERVRQVPYFNLQYYHPDQTGFFEDLKHRIEDMAVKDRPDALPDGHRPTIHTENVIIASGEHLIQNGLLQDLKDDHEERVSAGDEESFGFADALEGSYWAIFRGISDYGEEDKPNDWQYLAAFTAARLLRDYLRNEFTLADDDAF